MRETLAGIEPFLPEGMKLITPYDTTPVISASIEGVIHTLIEAIVLVFLVMYLFLQNFRATIIPTLAVPVVLLGTFAILAAFGFTINTLTMFAMVLAIGLLVDDAIVVVENVERVMSEEGLSPREATRKSMGQISGALVGIGLVLSAVFLPMAFFGGSTGVIYQQFSITIISAMVLSVLVALVFTPALCATLLKPVKAGHHHDKKGFFGWFNRTFERGVNKYERGVTHVLSRRPRYVLAFLVICGVTGWLFQKVPSAFLPPEDQAIMFTQIQTPTGSTVVRTQQVVDEVREYLLNEEKDVVQGMFSVVGFNFAGRGQNSAMAFVNLKPWDQREDDSLSVFALQQRAMERFSQIRDAMVFAFAPPAVMELGNAGGFDFYIQDRSGVGHEALTEARNQMLGMAAQSPILANTRPNGLNNEPQYQLKIDDEKARSLGVSLSDINQTLSIAWGSAYVNDFIDRGRVKKVFMQGQPDSRMNPEDFAKWHVRNNQGEMVPFSAFASGEWIYGPPKLSRFNGMSSMQIQGDAAPGYSTGDAMAEIERLATQLPNGVGIAWNGLSFEERKSAGQAPALYALSILVVFLCLAALYESWSIPFAVLLVVPLGVLGVILATYGRGLSNDVYFQVGLLTTIGLSARNAILVVEFARALYQQGMGLVEASVHAARMRIRPIIMTSLAFILGVVPLAIATGAGAGSKHAIGTGVIGGMLTAMVFAIFWIPLFYVMVTSIFGDKTKNQTTDTQVKP